MVELTKELCLLPGVNKMAKFPKEVTILYDNMICKHDIKDSYGRKCIFGWAINDFGEYSCGAIREKIHKLISSQLENDDCWIYWNDKSTTKKSTIAQVYNRATALLGYTEDNPEKRWASNYLKKQKTTKKIG